MGKLPEFLKFSTEFRDTFNTEYTPTNQNLGSSQLIGSRFEIEIHITANHNMLYYVDII